MAHLAWLVPISPLASFVVLVLWGSRLRGNVPAYVSIAGIALAWLWGWGIAGQVLLSHEHEVVRHSYPWAQMGERTLELGFMVDKLAAAMLFMVPFVAMLIQIYSIGYMHGDPQFSRFFAYMSLFCFSMLLLVISNNLLQMFISWELVGVCSYFLISFWYERKSAALAGKKAFITTRVGDVGMLIGIMVCFMHAGTLDFQRLFEIAASQPDQLWIGLAAFLLFFGAIGKSAQFPLHTWLPDAMEGPTPVSALIHAATMVAAGVYLVARTFPLFWVSRAAVVWDWHVLGIQFTAVGFVAVIGAITLLIAALMAVVQSDIKRVLAYSTISQLGYMMLALGMGAAGVAAGMFHLLTHAFFKACLFLGAGSVIHGADTNDMWKMGGLRKAMPHTYWTFMIAFLGLAGIVPFAGFWSKDEIVATVFGSGRTTLRVLAELGAFLTAFYMTRLMYLTFGGQPRDSSVHAHESPRVMTGPLWILAVGSVVVGLMGTPWWNKAHDALKFDGAASAGAHEVHAVAAHGPNWLVMGMSLAVAVGGILLARRIYDRPDLAGDPLKERFAAAYGVLENKFYMDWLYDIVIVKGIVINTKTGLMHLARSLDDWVIDRIVDGAAYVTVAWSAISGFFDDYVVDKIVDGFGVVCRAGGALVNLWQTGRVQGYLVGGLAVAAVAIMAVAFTM
ncbi:MAG: NADH-quinone oxidoreductase subunit L [Armatimonadota bacterium]